LTITMTLATLMIIHRVQLSHTGREAVHHQITQAHTEKALQDGKHRTDRASREVQASRQKAIRPQHKDEIMTCNLAKTIKAVTVRRTKKVKTKWKIKKDTL
jgi:hypothetical protein